MEIVVPKPVKRMILLNMIGRLASCATPTTFYAHVFYNLFSTFEQTAVPLPGIVHVPKSFISSSSRPTRQDAIKSVHHQTGRFKPATIRGFAIIQRESADEGGEDRVPSEIKAYNVGSVPDSFLVEQLFPPRISGGKDGGATAGDGERFQVQ